MLHSGLSCEVCVPSVTPMGRRQDAARAARHHKAKGVILIQARPCVHKWTRWLWHVLHALVSFSVLFRFLELLQQQILDCRAESLQQWIKRITSECAVHSHRKFSCVGPGARTNHVLKTSLYERCNIVLGPHLHFILLIIHAAPWEVLHKTIDSIHDAA